MNSCHKSVTIIVIIFWSHKDHSVVSIIIAECSTLTPRMPNLSGMGGGPMRPQLVVPQQQQQPVRRKSSIFRKIRDKLRRGSLVSSSTADSAQSSASASSAG